jgi:hypothetical protein
MPVTQATWEAKIRRIVVLGQPGLKILKKPISASKSWVWWCTSVIPARREAQIRESQSRPAQA